MSIKWWFLFLGSNSRIFYVVSHWFLSECFWHSTKKPWCGFVGFHIFVERLSILSQAGDDVNCTNGWVSREQWKWELTLTYMCVKQHSTAVQDNPKHQIKRRTDTSESYLWSFHSKGSFVLCASLLLSTSNTLFHTFSTGHWHGLLTTNTKQPSLHKQCTIQHDAGLLFYCKTTVSNLSNPTYWILVLGKIYLTVAPKSKW